MTCGCFVVEDAGLWVCEALSILTLSELHDDHLIGAVLSKMMLQFFYAKFPESYSIFSTLSSYIV